MGSLFGATPKPPAIQPPAPMPVPDNAAIAQARQRQAAVASQQTGRQSTILTDNATKDKLGQ